MSYDAQPGSELPSAAGRPDPKPASIGETTIVPFTAERVAAVARLHRTAFSAAMGAHLGSGYVRALVNWFRQADGAINLIAIDSTDRVMGYALGAPRGYTRVRNRHLLLPAAVGLLLHPGLFLDARFRHELRSPFRMLAGRAAPRTDEPTLPAPTLSLAAIGVDPAAQGRGIGALLLTQFEQHARARQMRSMRLVVYAHNTAARRLYEKCGWEACGPRDERHDTVLYAKTL
jgi:ribosomal protein S18 acetylase RimI-like enzyme